MSKLNPNKGHPLRNKGVSFNGNVQDLKSSEQQLYETIVTTLFGNDSYYESNDVTCKRLKENVDKLVAKDSFDYIANAIIHARVAMNIRTMPIILTVLFAKSLREQNKSYTNMRVLVNDVVQRADQITDMFAYAVDVFGSAKAMPMALKRGLGDAFNKFNEYTFAKYNRKGSVKFTDVMRVVHPKAKNEAQGVIFDKLMNEARQESDRSENGFLKTPYTWETQLSDAGNTGKSKRDVWSELIESGQMGYMSMLRNLRNIKEAGVSQNVMNTVYTRLADPNEVARSKQLPFRFVNAYEAVQREGDQKLQRAISRAMDCSLSNIPQLGDNVWIVVDVSGSMRMRMRMCGSSNSTPIKTATLFAAALAKANAEANNVKVTMFSDTAQHVSFNTDDSVISIAENFSRKVHGYGTNLESAWRKISTLGFKPDTVIVLSDMQVNRLDGASKVAHSFDGNVVKVAVNLQGYDSTPLSEICGWHQLSGFSERMFDFIPAIRNKTSITKMLSVPYIGANGIKEMHGI